MKEFRRERELNFLSRFVSEQGSGFLYVRGRRRVGKSWLLTTFQNETKNCFLFSGEGDSDSAKTLHHFVSDWSKFSGSDNLLKIRSVFLDWKTIFDEIGLHASRLDGSLTLIFDEIQWIAKEKSGFCSKLKEAWVAWQKAGKIKVILCGSSNRFFSKKAGGQEKILRGLQTTASLFVEPLSLRETFLHCCPKWKQQEACLLYMMLGGIPYYLEQIDASKGFVHAINDALFTRRSIFLEEADELLDLDFNVAGKRTAKKILAALGQDGSTQDKIVAATGISSSTVSDVLEKLCEYRIVFEKMPAHTRPQRNRAGIRYFAKDFFLNFYFQVMDKLKTKIMRNERDLIFPCDVLTSLTQYYIPNFSGKAFEHLVRHVLEKTIDLSEAVFNKLLVTDADFEVLDYWDQHTQVDLIVEHRKDRLSRLIECKWGKPHLDWLAELLKKSYFPPEPFQKRLFLISSEKLTQPLIEKAKVLDTTLIELGDLF